MEKKNVEEFVRVEGLRRHFFMGQSRIEVLNGVDLSVGAGEIVGVMGASGAGKSTLLHIMGALDKPSEGRVLYNGTDIFAMEERELASFRSRMVGFVFQFHHLLSEFTAEENVALAAMIAGANRRDAVNKAGELLEMVGLKARSGHRPGKLSGGEQQRVAIARALVNGPAMVLADEPTGNLDTATGDEVFGLVTKLNAERGQTFVIVTHNQSLAEKMGRVVRMKDGMVYNDSFVSQPEQ
ncbi:MAG: ABC transporter ATP-binding protein [Nitrospinae bacterium]|nr:ABC transporter ATP-binding protein [Nitrospinota bacterium]